MGTLQQRKVAEAVAHDIRTNTRRSAGSVLKSVGYGTGLQNQPHRVFKSKGFKEELDKLGLSLEETDNIVRNILVKGKHEVNKLKAADMIYKRLGAYEDTKQSAGKTLIINVTQETAERYAITPNSETSSEG